MEPIIITDFWASVVTTAVATLLLATSEIRNRQGYREARKEYLGKPMQWKQLPRGIKHKLVDVTEAGTSKGDKIIIIEYQPLKSSWYEIVCATIEPNTIEKARLQQGDTFVITQNGEIIKQETPPATTT
jgi:hypothetical protein